MLLLSPSAGPAGKARPLCSHVCRPGQAPTWEHGSSAPPQVQGAHPCGCWRAGPAQSTGRPLGCRLRVRLPLRLLLGPPLALTHTAWRAVALLPALRGRVAFDNALIVLVGGQAVVCARHGRDTVARRLLCPHERGLRITCHLGSRGLRHGCAVPCRTEV